MQEKRRAGSPQASLLSRVSEPWRCWGKVLMVATSSPLGAAAFGAWLRGPVWLVADRGSELRGREGGGK